MSGKILNPNGSVASPKHDPLAIKPGDDKAMATVAEVKALLQMQRKVMTSDLNKIIGDFQKEVVQGSVRLNLVWNGVNAVLRALLSKAFKLEDGTILPLISPDDVKEAGEVLMEEANKNIAATQEAMDAGRRVDQSDLIPTPLDMIRTIMQGLTKRVVGVVEEKKE